MLMGFNRQTLRGSWQFSPAVVSRAVRPARGGFWPLSADPGCHWDLLVQLCNSHHQKWYPRKVHCCLHNHHLPPEYYLSQMQVTLKMTLSYSVQWLRSFTQFQNLQCPSKFPGPLNHRGNKPRSHSKMSATISPLGMTPLMMMTLTVYRYPQWYPLLSQPWTTKPLLPGSSLRWFHYCQTW